MDFKNFREIFYFLQLQFYCRGRRRSFSMYQLLIDLVLRSDEVHLGWKTQQACPPLRGCKRAPRKATRDAMPVAPMYGGALLISEDLPSLSCNAFSYMAFDFPKGYRRDQLLSMYKSLLVYDVVVLSGVKKITAADLFKEEKIQDLLHLRRLTEYEYSLGCRFEAETSTLCNIFGNILFSGSSKTPKRKTTDNDPISSNFLETSEIDRYLRRAEMLLHLAENGLFKQYPHHLKKP